MARRKTNLRTHSKSVTVEGASTEHVDQETNQEMHEASTQGMGLQLDIEFASSLLKNSIKKKKKTKTKAKWVTSACKIQYYPHAYKICILKGI